MEKIVHIVHAIDTEGPIYESLKASFERLNQILGIKLKPSHENLKAIRNKQIDLNGKEELAADFLSPERIEYNDSWDKIDIMLKKIMSKEYRDKFLDSFGGGWIYNWYCLDLIGFDHNPRRKEIGYHCVFDRYTDFIEKYDSYQDDIQFHFHPMSIYKEAHKFATSYQHSEHLYQTLSRRIIDRNSFPNSFRPGFHTERPDSNWFLEQWIPFDLANQANENEHEKQNYANLKNGRLGDWRGAPMDWSIYNPDLYDYRKPGNLKRYIARCLNMQARHSNLNQNEVDKAFARANNGKPTLLGFTNHDFRDMEPEIDLTLKKIKISSKKYPDVKFKFSRTDEAFRNVLFNGKKEKLKLDVEMKEDSGKLRLFIKTINSEVFGPQPYLAIKTKGNRYIHENLDFSENKGEWFYAFDDHSIFPNDIDTIGIAANNIFGDTFIKTIKY